MGGAKLVICKIVRGTRGDGAGLCDGRPASTLPGARFEVRDAAGNLVGSCVSRQDGGCIVLGVPFGTYSVVEVAAPRGFVLDPTPRSITASTREPRPRLFVPNDPVTPPESETPDDPHPDPDHPDEPTDPPGPPVPLLPDEDGPHPPGPDHPDEDGDDEDVTLPGDGSASDDGAGPDTEVLGVALDAGSTPTSGLLPVTARLSATGVGALALILLAAAAIATGTRLRRVGRRLG